MTIASLSTLTAFVPSRAALSTPITTGRLFPSSTTTTTTTITTFTTSTRYFTPSSTSLYLLDPLTKSAYLSFFDGIKIPATLIAGTSLAALFALTDEVKDMSYISKLRILVMRIYHVCSLLCFLTSLTSVMTAQAATTMILFEGNGLMSAKAVDLRSFFESMNFEFVLTRWSFIISILLLLCSTTLRMILEFNLFTRRRRIAGFMVVSMMAGVMGSSISCLNTTQKSWPNLWFMTREVAIQFWERIYVKRYPLQIVAAAFVGISILCSLYFLMPTTFDSDQLADHERYT